MRKLRLIEAKSVAQGFRLSIWWSWDSNLFLFCQAVLSSFYLIPRLVTRSDHSYGGWGCYITSGGQITGPEVARVDMGILPLGWNNWRSCLQVEEVSVFIGRTDCFQHSVE